MHSPEKQLTITNSKQTNSYIVEGPTNAPAIIFIHGFPLNKTMWNKQIEELKKDYFVIAYDIRGHGSTDSGNDDFSIELFANDLLRLMDALKIDKTILCGFSMGGYIALNAIENHPERFNSLILCDTNCTADDREAKEKRTKSIESIKLNGLEQYADESLKKLFSPISLSKKTEEIALVREMIIKTSTESVCKTLLALAKRKETCSRLHEITVPVLILVGNEDEITAPNLAIAMHEKIKSSTIHIIENAGHLSNMENPEQFNNYLVKFLTQINKSYTKKI